MIILELSYCELSGKGVDEFLKLNAEQRKGRIMIHLVKQVS